MADKVVTEIAFERFPAFLTNREDLDRLALFQKRFGFLARELGDVGVEATTQAALGGENHQELNLIAAGARNELRRGCAVADGSRQPGHNGIEPLGVGTAVFRSFLGAAKFRRGHHLHGFCDLPSVLHTLDPVF